MSLKFLMNWHMSKNEGQKKNSGTLRQFPKWPWYNRYTPAPASQRKQAAELQSLANPPTAVKDSLKFGGLSILMHTVFSLFKIQ